MHRQIGCPNDDRGDATHLTHDRCRRVRAHPRRAAGRRGCHPTHPPAAFDRTVEGHIVDDLRETEWSIEGGSLVAHDEGDQIVGHVLLSRGDLVDGEGRTWTIGVIGPVAVLPECQGRGIGAGLMRGPSR